MVLTLTGYTEKQALRWLSDATQADLQPVLTQDELRRLLAVCRVADEDGNLPDSFDAWTASETYAVGERVVPVPRNGYVYRVVTSGQSGTVAPTWSTTIDASVTDNTVTWTVEDDADWVPTYDATRIRKAAAAGWRLKADKLSEGETFSGDGFSDHPETRRQYCLDRAKTFEKGSAGTMMLGGSIYDGYRRPHVEIVN